jgi:iron(III) transport system substrate-binding protein
MLSKRVPRKGYSILAVVTCCVMLLIFLLGASLAKAADKPRTVAEIALYQAPDRMKILIEGAKKEGTLTLYDSHTWFKKHVVGEFEKKYPFIKVLEWRSGPKKLLKRVAEEYGARQFTVDVINTNRPSIDILHQKIPGIFQEYYFPEADYFADESKVKGKRGFYYLADYEMYLSLGFNTKLVSPNEAPKKYEDLLDPKWKGKMSIPSTSTGSRWLGNAIDTMGRDFIEKLSNQEIKVQHMSGGALAGMVVAGEVPLSPTIYYSNFYVATRQGAPVVWRPLDPVLVLNAASGISANAPHPHAAMLFLNWWHSKEGQKTVIEGGLCSPRSDVVSIKQKFKKTYQVPKYSLEEYERKYKEWEGILSRLFIKKQ